MRTRPRSTDIAERNRVFGLQGIRGLGGGLFRPTDEVLTVIVANPTMIVRPRSETQHLVGL